MARRRRTRRLPVALVVPAALGALLLGGPLVALLLRAPWIALPALLAGPVVLPALGLSLGTALASTAICLLVGVPLAAALAGSDGWPLPLRRAARALVATPLVLPPVIGGIALLLLLGRTGLLGRPLLAAFGIGIPFSTTAVVLAQAFVGLPFTVLSVEGALRGVDPRFPAAAATLGASPWIVFSRVVLPLAAPGVAAGAVLSFARALGEFGATITFAGSLPGVTQTLPVAAYVALTDDLPAALAIAVLLVVVSAAVLVSLRERWLVGLRP
ncbi:molybdate ABC transporter permease subunit [Amnibacterium sp. CER49]|uniref:molybdate ABC transporter permease subunit n=1 Tax=Amnibacterium sp. CER49 TaxID=3039161 RepID=UPI00244B1DA7|nr:molybdate ABC transporter permease subunit [Amnibacterium sp. CER49]MDH2442862.1 molybdate ABC transporter permease subunit [Amnibacterium sp. CER49]